MKNPLDPKRLRRRRIEAGLNQKQLAAKAGCSRSLICSAEGDSTHLSPEKLAKIAAALGCGIADLLPDENPSTTATGSAA